MARSPHLNAKQQLEESVRLAEMSAPPCFQCKYYKGNPFSTELGKCKNPVISPMEYVPATGKWKQERRFVTTARGEYGDCGPQGRGFYPHAIGGLRQFWYGTLPEGVRSAIMIFLFVSFVIFLVLAPTLIPRWFDA